MTTSGIERVNVAGLARLPEFSHASISGGWVHVSGMLGTLPGGVELAEGGALAQASQALENLVQVLEACGCAIGDVIKVGVFLTDLSTFPAVNSVYASFFDDAPPARVAVGVDALAFGAVVEFDCVAVQPLVGD